MLHQTYIAGHVKYTTHITTWQYTAQCTTHITKTHIEKATVAA